MTKQIKQVVKFLNEKVNQEITNIKKVGGNYLIHSNQSTWDEGAWLVKAEFENGRTKTIAINMNQYDQLQRELRANNLKELL